MILDKHEIDDATRIRMLSEVSEEPLLLGKQSVEQLLNQHLLVL